MSKTYSNTLLQANNKLQEQRKNLLQSPPPVTSPEDLDRAWAETAVSRELAVIAKLPAGTKLTKPGNAFYIALLKIASVAKGSGRRHLRPSDLHERIEAHCPKDVRYKLSSREREIAYQWGRAYTQAEPRYRQTNTGR